MLRKKIGFLGCGNMGKGILAGLLAKRIALPGDIRVYDVVPEKLAGIKRQFKVKTAANMRELVKQSDIVILAIKPQDLSAASREIRPDWKASHILVTILAGVSTQRIRKELGSGVRVVRAMPNLGATIGEAVTAVTASRKSDLKTGNQIFSGCGAVLNLPEKYFDAVTALSGSGPAYFFHLIELMENEAVRLGLSENAARLLVKQTAKGAALLACQSQEPASILRQRVTSKGGTTEAALNTLAEGKFPMLFGRAIANAVKRAKKLGRG